VLSVKWHFRAVHYPAAVGEYHQVMARLWFVSAPLLGHLDWGGFLRTAQVLQQMGHEVTWVSGSPVAGAIQRAGIAFAPIRQTGWLWPPPPAPDLSSIPPQEAVMLRYRRALDTWLTEDRVAEAVEALVELAAQIGKPDLIATDPFLTAAALAAEVLAVPLVVGGWPAQADLDAGRMYPVQQSLGQESQARLGRLQDRFRLEGINFSKGPTPSIISPRLHVSYFTQSWYQIERDALLPQNAFVGGHPTPPQDAPPDWLRAIPEDQPLALITLGSVFTGDLGFFSWAAQAAARLGLLSIVVLGWNPIEPEEKAKLIAALPGSTRLLNWVDFAHVLPRTRLIIHHGGMGTTHAAVVHGLPQIVVPHAADQRGQARRVAQAKVGLNLSAHDVRNGALLEGSRALLQDRQVLARARQLAADMAALGGPERAAHLILEAGAN
ncbi:MAG: glycosyltransferase, partial [Anaerolineae bacterium]|nr:glycosyltransferase [Anaerolineae bacterium]